MRYDVYLGEATIYGISEVEENVGRAIGIHNGLGQGNFVLGGDRELRRFGLSCELSEQNSQNASGWSPAKNLFDYFERLLEERDPMRLIIVSEHSQISLPVLLESYTKTEAYAGIYEVGLKLIEHRACAVQSAEVPYVKRPGKLPVVIADKITVKPRGNSKVNLMATLQEGFDPNDPKWAPWLTASDGEKPIDMPSTYAAKAGLRNWQEKQFIKKYDIANYVKIRDAHDYIDKFLSESSNWMPT